VTVPGTGENAGVDSAEVVIVGGGAMGASVAYHLAAAGLTDVVLIERDSLAAGSTSRSAGGIRTQFADELNIRIALRSLAEFEHFAELTGVEIDFHQVGYLFLLDDPGDLERFRAALAVQHSLGVPACELTIAEALEIVPQLEPEGLLAATFCPLDGHATPEAVVRGYATAAAERGVRIEQGCAIEAVDVCDARIVAVRTSRGRIATGTVVCTAGAWSADVAALAGVDMPVQGEARWMWFSPADGGLPARLPLTIDFTTGFYLHREGPGIVFGGREASLEEVAEHGVRRLPLLADLPIQSSWSGFYEQSPDHNAIVGEVASRGRFLYATGFSGHGFQQAPAVGEHVAELILGCKPTLDLAPFSLERFGRGEARAELVVV
jgi:sarcosine oxidase subunit beta